MICAATFKKCQQLTSHLLGHHAADLQVLGYERFMLARGHKEQVDE